MKCIHVSPVFIFFCESYIAPGTNTVILELGQCSVPGAIFVGRKVRIAKVPKGNKGS